RCVMCEANRLIKLVFSGLSPLVIEDGYGGPVRPHQSGFMRPQPRRGCGHMKDPGPGQMRNEGRRVVVKLPRFRSQVGL
ncbi:hypothetical protein MXD62_08560, partial [Frankia sp. Mgl5]|uniref:hypothetical protein n=1 Tax=Frankia sp. Mgl5 TaxID=2933793 RepID=UPI00201005B1